MKIIRSAMKRIANLGLILMMGVSMNANAGWFGLGGTSWQEEVLLHDGTKVIVERSIERGGRHEIGQKPPVKKETLAFYVLGSQDRIHWKTEYQEDIGYADLGPILLEVVGGKPYLVTQPIGCLAFNKWQRPNPPYIFFRYENGVWKQIGLQEVPLEIKTPNLIISSPDVKAEQSGKSLILAADIAGINSSLTQPEYRAILREPLKNAGGRCGEMVPYGKGGWLGIDWFTDQPSLGACLKFCERKQVSAEDCPCNSIFKGAK